MWCDTYALFRGTSSYFWAGAALFRFNAVFFYIPLGFFYFIVNFNYSNEMSLLLNTGRLLEVRLWVSAAGRTAWLLQFYRLIFLSWCKNELYWGLFNFSVELIYLYFSTPLWILFINSFFSISSLLWPAFPFTSTTTSFAWICGWVLPPLLWFMRGLGLCECNVEWTLGNGQGVWVDY